MFQSYTPIAIISRSSLKKWQTLRNAGLNSPGPLPSVHPLAQGWGTYALSRAAWMVEYRWRTAKSINFMIKFYHYLTMRKSDSSWLAIFSTCSSWSSVSTRYCIRKVWCRSYQMFTRAAFGPRAAGSPSLLSLWTSCLKDAHESAHQNPTCL